ncbi:MAG: hypothetical protein ACOY15_06745 [Pseudomonadota bacterium]
MWSGEKAPRHDAQFAQYFHARGPGRKHGVGDADIYKWKASYGGLEVSEAWRLNKQGGDSAQH